MQTVLFLKQDLNISCISNLLDLNFLELNYIEECHKVEPTISPEKVALIEKQLSSQKVMPFFDTVLEELVPLNLVPPVTPIHQRSHLIKSVCYPHLFRFNTVASGN